MPCPPLWPMDDPVFFFMQDEVWRQHMDELGIRETIDYLIAKGLPANWPTGIVDPAGYGVCYLPGGKPWYKSDCPHYEGYYLHGGLGTVRCNTAGELLPGIVHHKVCSKEFNKCPFYKEG